MSPGILGKKIGMTQVFREDGQVVPVTVLKAGPCVVVQRKTPTSDGYDAVQLGLMEYIKKTSISKPATGHLKKSGAEGVKFMREFRLEEGATAMVIQRAFSSGALSIESKLRNLFFGLCLPSTLVIAAVNVVLP